jgi:uncharacterized cupredoxin-like copper-binding protein
MMDSKDEQIKDKEKFCNLKPGRSAEVSWDASKRSMIKGLMVQPTTQF